MIITKTSPLMKLPANLDVTQALLIDGVRHAAEIVQLAYVRLTTSLTELSALEADFNAQSTAAYLDAWALVDAVDRFRQIWESMPGPMMDPHAPPLPTLDPSFRELRNINDHIATRLSRLVAKKATAMGTLSWVTWVNPDQGLSLLCVLAPGTATDKAMHIPSMTSRPIAFPSGAIRLEAGGYAAYLEEALPYVATRIKQLEATVSRFAEKLPTDTEWAASDMLLKFTLQFEGEITTIHVEHDPDT